MIAAAERRRQARRFGALIAAFALCLPLPPALASDSPDSASEDADDEDETPWERLTERPDKRRPLDPFEIDVFGRSITLGGELETELGYLRNRVLGENVDEPDRLMFVQNVVLEAFHSFGERVSLFTQIEVVVEQDLLPDTFESVHDAYVERGEMWLYAENIAGSHVNLDFGRLDFEDDRHWWWDDTLDAVRVAYERDDYEIAIAVARELGSNRSDQDDVDPEHGRVLRWIGEVSWDFSRAHALQLFVLHGDDHSHREKVGQIGPIELEDESDAKLTWFGARSTGIFELGRPGALGYWIDAAGVVGDERFALFEEIPGRQSAVEEVIQRDVSGWGIDAGATWFLPLAMDPRFYVGYAYGSGDSTPEQGSDRSFRQTGIESNEAGFGGVELFPSYGLLLDPELSNLGILTLGVGLSLLRSSSIDLVYHHYRLAEPAFELRDTRLEAELDGRSRNLGHEIDLFVAIEEWERLEFAFGISGFRADHAFGDEQGKWSFGVFAGALLAF